MNVQSSTSRQAIKFTKMERPQSEPVEASLKLNHDSFVPAAASEQFVRVGGGRWMASPEQLADVELHYIDGSSVTVPDGKAVADQLARTKDGTLDWFKPSGHGSDNRFGASMGFDINDEGAPGLTTM